MTRASEVRRCREQQSRPKKYKTADGDYLVVVENRDGGGGFRLAWFIAEWEDDGAVVGESQEPIEPPSDKNLWETWQADRSVKPLADDKDSKGYLFHTEKKARMALAAANHALHTGEAPWPAWALQAKQAGWTPPEGWKP